MQSVEVILTIAHQTYINKHKINKKRDRPHIRKTCGGENNGVIPIGFGVWGRSPHGVGAYDKGHLSCVNPAPGSLFSQMWSTPEMAG